MTEPAAMTEPAVHGEHQRVGWFELFYDLVIVAAVGFAAHTFVEEPTWSLSFWIAAWTLIMFVLWLLTSLNHNLYPGDHPTRRILGLIQMLALVVASLGTVSEHGLPNSVGFAALAVAFATVAVMYAVAIRGPGVDRADVRVLGWSSAAAALVLALGMLLPADSDWTLSSPATWLIVIGVAIAAVPLFGFVVGHLADRIDDEHLGERLGQLVIIVLGESFVSLISALSGESTIPNPFFFVITFAVVFAIWTLYFSSVVPAGMPKTSGALRAWVFTHWLLMFGAVGAAAGFSAVTLVAFGDTSPNVASRWTTLPLALVMIALAILTWLGTGSAAGLVRLHLVTAAALLVLALVGSVVTTADENWEIALGSLLVIVDAVVAARRVRPYRSTEAVSS